jgi:hypothetical protein
MKNILLIVIVAGALGNSVMADSMRPMPIAKMEVIASVLPGKMLQINNTMELLIAADTGGNCDPVSGCAFGGFERSSQYAGDGGIYRREIIDMTKLECKTLVDTNESLAVHCETNFDQNISTAVSLKNIFPLMKIFGIGFPGAGINQNGDSANNEVKVVTMYGKIENDTIMRRTRVITLPIAALNRDCDYFEGCEIPGIGTESFRIEKNNLIVRTFFKTMNCKKSANEKIAETECSETLNKRGDGGNGAQN